ncbi:MAG: competence/damage-inducible protein A [Rikenellaceae bacterium]|nr:competence/damage-inducible protein A [Rikenellaceae bacterium]
MTAEIITIGDEILIGQVVDTNSAWLGQKLNEYGVQIVRITSVRDDKNEIIETLDSSLSRSDLVLITGGLGPTKDDLTKKTLAEYFECKLVMDEGAYRNIENLVRERGFDFNELKQQQALVPEKCTVIPNLHGTAPGMWFEKEGRIVVSMPGVPFEMKAMVDDYLIEMIKRHFSLRNIIHKTAITYGIPESALAIKIEPWEDSLPEYLKLAYLPNPNCIRLRLSAYESDKEKVMKVIDEKFAELQKMIPESFLGYGDTSLEGVVADMLLERKETLSVAESCTGGYISSLFTAMNGASDYLTAGVVSYTVDAKVNILGVNREDVDRYGVVSEEVAKQMAEGVRRLNGTTYGISTTGIAGPTGETEETPVGTVCIGVATPHGTITRKFMFGKLRNENIKRASANAINMLRMEIKKH